MRRNRIALNWIYLRSVNGPDFNPPDSRSDAMAEFVLHRFFQTLRTPYRAYQARNAGRSRAGHRRSRKQQNFPLDFLERIPRQDYSRHCLAAAALCCLLLLVYRAMQLRSWA